ncbi:ABC transporter permease [Devosia sp. MC521]|uniref:ABC transporter permease n=1 Tax=Devosia sp. MC521 TaxID=2759954 RepID=UPI0015F973A1|nr:ABC transporter permease [Devosia sp. MC521]MBJ6988427.1 ABC transporter permease [Devosia sp. MC521]QMW62472.1 ABC transporter permease [Devosia sp. MC521]
MTDATNPNLEVRVEKLPFIERIPQSLAIAMVLFILVSAWQIAFSLKLVSPIILPSPGETFSALVIMVQNLVTGGYVFQALMTTGSSVLIAFVLAIIVGVCCGIIVGETSIGERAIMPIFVALDTMPKVAFTPLFVAWLGFGIQSKVALAIFVTVFPIIISTAAGLNSTDANGRMLFKTLGASRLQTLFKLKIPTALPYIMTGVKIAAVSVVAGVIMGEFMGGGRGFGDLIRTSSVQLNTAQSFALIFLLSLVGITLFSICVAVQKRFVYWQKSSRIRQVD